MSQHAGRDGRDALGRRHLAEHGAERQRAPREPARVVLGDGPALEGRRQQRERDAAQDPAEHEDRQPVEAHGRRGERVRAAERQARRPPAQPVRQVAREERRRRRRHVRAGVERRDRRLVQRLLVPEERVREGVLKRRWEE